MKDLLGLEIKVGDFVAGLESNNSTPELYSVQGFTPKMVNLSALSGPNYQMRKLPVDILVLDPDQVKERMAQPPKDLLGQDLNIDDYVVGSDGSYVDPVIYQITNFAAHCAYVESIGSNTFGKVRVCTDLIKVNPVLITMMQLTKDRTDG